MSQQRLQEVQGQICTDLSSTFIRKIAQHKSLVRYSTTQPMPSSPGMI